jgi:hypothetical protein
MSMSKKDFADLKALLARVGASLGAVHPAHPDLAAACAIVRQRERALTPRTAAEDTSDEAAFQQHLSVVRRAQDEEITTQQRRFGNPKLTHVNSSESDAVGRALRERPDERENETTVPGTELIAS